MRSVCPLLALLVLDCDAALLPSPFVNTSAWLGSGYYAPAPSPDNLDWWLFYGRYRPAVLRELPLLRPTLAFNTLRVFLHTLAWENDAPGLLANVEDFLSIANASGLKTGLVLFGSGPQTNASTTRCVPRKGLSNGCWRASPLDVDSTSVDRYRPYVEGIVGAHAHDTRVAFWELMNEPVNKTFWNDLRDAAYGWARDLRPVAPIISCWLDNIDTQLVDVHVYSQGFASVWIPRIFTNASKGALITEGGGRWTEPPAVPVTSVEDYGSPLATLNFLRALRLHAGARYTPFVPGVLLGWEAVMGNSYSRYYWGSKVGSPEPHIPWLGHLWADGTPVSFTEAAALRSFAGAPPEWLAFDKFLNPTEIRDGNTVLTLNAGDSHVVRGAGGATYALTDALVEVAMRPQTGATVSVTVRARAIAVGVFDGYTVRVSTTDATLWVDRTSGGSTSRLGLTYPLGSRENGLCIGCFNLLRVALSTLPDGRVRVRVWMNVMYTDSGFLNDDDDAERVPHAPVSLIDVVDGSTPLGDGPLVIATEGGACDIDYAAALPMSVLDVGTLSVRELTL